MNANQIINIVVRMVMRRLVRSGVNAGIGAVSKRRNADKDMGAKPPNSAETSKRAKQTIRMMRRLR